MVGGVAGPAPRPPAPKRTHSYACTRPRATIASKSVPAGSVPYSRPPSRPRRAAQKASATAGSPWRTSSEPCSARAIDSTTRRARDSSVAGSDELVLEAVEVGVQAPVGAARVLELVQEHLQRARGAHQRAQHVEAHHVARALPDRGQRRLAVEARHPRLLDVAVAAEALQRLEGVVGGALADPVLRHGGRQALEQVGVAELVAARAGLRAGLVVGAREAHREHRRGLGLDAQVGEHVAHQRLVDQQLAEGRAVGGVVGGGDDPRAHPRRAADHAVQAGVADHLDDRRHAAAGLAEHPRPRAVELDLRGGVGVVAELVLQALDVEGVARAVGQHAGQQKAGEPGGASPSARARGRGRTSAPSRTTCARRARTRRPAPPPFSGRASGRVGAHVRAALLLGHRHAGDRRALLCRRRSRRGSYVVAVTSGSHSAASSRLARSAGTTAKVIVIGQAKPASACIAVMYSAARATCAAGSAECPRQRVQLVLHAHRHQVVPRRVELDLVDAVARSGRACAARACSRWPGAPRTAAVGRRRTGRARRRAPCAQPPPSRSSASTSGQIAGEDVHALQRRGLV